MSRTSEDTTKPEINVTPLIDVLLVLLIIFMVSVPLKPKRFLTQAPSEPDKTQPQKIEPHPWTLVVTIEPDHTLKLNALGDMGSVEDTSKVSEALTKLFEDRVRNRAFRPETAALAYLKDDERIERTVYIKAPRAMRYEHIVKVIDGLKGAGAKPIGLQLDGLN
jgi:biopolymer transport protein ExbD